MTWRLPYWSEVSGSLAAALGCMAAQSEGKKATVILKSVSGTQASEDEPLIQAEWMRLASGHL